MDSALFSISDGGRASSSWEWIRTLRWCSWALALIALCPGMEKANMELRLESVNRLGLRATIRNVGPRSVAVLHNADLQPSRVVLKDSAGTEVKPFDNRTRAKFDRTVRAAMFQPVPPGGSMELGVTKFQKETDGQYELDWGPYHYGDLAPGVWNVSLVFDAVIDSPTGGSKIAAVWKGTALAPALTVKLP